MLPSCTVQAVTGNFRVLLPSSFFFFFPLGSHMLPPIKPVLNAAKSGDEMVDVGGKAGQDLLSCVFFLRHLQVCKCVVGCLLCHHLHTGTVAEEIASQEGQ